MSMENIFKNAKFGDKFRTKDGREAVLVNWSQNMDKAVLYVKERDIEFFGEEYYELDGTTHDGSSLHDIIGKWEEPINEEELNNLATEYAVTDNILHPGCAAFCAYKASYRKAKDIAKELLKHPDFEVKFHDFHQEFAGGPLICDSWENVKVGDIGHSDKVIILVGDIE